MTQKEKVEAYDKALEMAKKELQVCGSTDCDAAKQIFRLFPELKESENEKIRKEIINIFHSLADGKIPVPINFADIFTWLEKQGEPELSEDLGEYIAELSKQFPEVSFAKLSRIAVRIKNWLEKQAEKKHKFIIGDIISNGNVTYRVDNIVKNAIGQDCYFLVNIKSEKNGTRYHKLHYSDGSTRNSGETTWLCEQVDAKFEKKFVVDFKAEDWYVSKVDGKIYDLTYNPTPKFHIGDWVISTLPGIKYPHLITDIKNGYYIFGEDDDHVHIASNDNILKLWTIDDAKDGDILVYNNTVTEIILLFKSWVANREAAYTYFHIFDNNYRVNSSCDCSKGAHPATKKQRDLLFQKMKKEGYKWDIEKKELKKIEDEEYNGEDYGIDGLYHAQRILEKTLGKVSGYQTDDGILSHKCAITAVKKLYGQKPAWSEEDTFMYNKIKNLLTDISLAPESRNSLFDWLKSLKERVQPKQEWKQENTSDLTDFENAMMHIGSSFFGENAGLDPNDTSAIKEQANLLLELVPKTEWSEEDEKRLKSCLNILQPKTLLGNTETINTKWLKSLKQRYTWKPSDKQMNALDSTLQYSQVLYNSYEHLNSLYNDLKKLTE